MSRDLIRVRAKRDGITYGAALQALLAEQRAERVAHTKANAGRSFGDMVEAPRQPRLPAIHRRYSSILTGPAASDPTMRSKPRCRSGYGRVSMGPVWDPDDPRLTDDPTAVTCGQCRRFSP